MFNFKTENYGQRKKELLSKEELALMRGGFGIEDVTVEDRRFKDRNFARHLGERIGVAIDARGYNNFANRHL